MSIAEIEKVIEDLEFIQELLTQRNFLEKQRSIPALIKARLLLRDLQMIQKEKGETN